MRTTWFLGLILLAALVVESAAIDRDARFIDTVSVEGEAMDDMDSLSLNLWGETLLAPEREDWALLFGGGIGKLSPDTIFTVSETDGTLVEREQSDVDFWQIGLGLKFYLAPPTSLSAVASYAEYEQNGVEREAKGATFTAKQRLLPADNPMSPFAKGSYTIRERSSFSSAGTRGTFSENLFALGGGIEFGAGENFSFVFEAARVESDTSDDDAEDLDGWRGSFAMRYYFENENL